jgi:hypothetical protein
MSRVTNGLAFIVTTTALVTDGIVAVVEDQGSNLTPARLSTVMIRVDGELQAPAGYLHFATTIPPPGSISRKQEETCKGGVIG